MNDLLQWVDTNQVVVKHSKELTGEGAFLRWKKDDELCFLQIVETAQDSLVVLDIDFSADNYNNKVEFQLKPLDYKKTLLTCEYRNQNTLSPWKRMSYLWNVDEHKAELNRYLQRIKTKSESVSHQRIVFSEMKTMQVRDVLLCFAKKTGIDNLEENKKRALVKMRRTAFRFKRLLPLDTIRTSFIRYTNWGEDEVKFEVCVPMTGFPKRKSILTWIPRNKVDYTPKKYFTALFLGKEQDLALGWDSLFHIAAKKNFKTKGFPAEKVISDTPDDFGRKKWQFLIEIE